MNPILQVFYSAFSGALLAAAIPNEYYLFGCPIIAFFSLIPYYIVFTHIKDYKSAFLMGFIQAITTHFISSFWLGNFKEFALFTLGASAFGTGLIGGLFALVIYIPFSSSESHNKLNEFKLYVKFSNTQIFKILYFASIYTLYEWGKSSGFLGYPWGTVSSAMFNWRILMQIASITGTYGITFFTALCNALFAETIIYFTNAISNQKNRKENLHTVKVLTSVFAILILVYGLFQYNKTRKPEKIVTTILVQQNCDPWQLDTDNHTILESQQLTKQVLDKEIENEHTVDLVVWSEGCLLSRFPYAKTHYKFFPSQKPLSKFVDECNIPFIFGGSYTKDSAKRQYYNASILFDKDGNYRGVYGKNHLVPFAESIPFIEIPAVANVIKKIVGISAGWTPGDQYVFFEIPCKATKNLKLPASKTISLNEKYIDTSDEISKTTVKIATPICFDDAFTDIMRPLFKNGAEIFINITDDSWSLKKSSELQHFVIASYRAIEYRTTLVRSANSGYSVVVDPAGKILTDMPLFEQASTVYDVPVYEHKMTTYAQFGNWLPYVIIFLLLIYGFYFYLNFNSTDFIPSERKIKKSSKKKDKKKSKKNSKK